MDKVTRRRFEDLMLRLLDIDPEGPESACLQDEIRQLPGYPTEAKPWDTVIILAKPTTSISVPRN